jgi:5,10-methylene-tetrahydrofolate dehydrogenase/methenyl tetrahydrofolate cyclohydrolase
VTYCHSSTEDLPTIVHSADIVVAAVGRAHFVRGEWIKPEAVVRDAGYNEVNCERRGLLQGRFGANLITSVPGGVGPTTIAIRSSRPFQRPRGRSPPRPQMAPTWAFPKAAPSWRQSD